MQHFHTVRFIYLIYKGTYLVYLGISLLFIYDYPSFHADDTFLYRCHLLYCPHLFKLLFYLCAYFFIHSHFLKYLYVHLFIFLLIY